jgi:hypothetical protein
MRATPPPPAWCLLVSWTVPLRAPPGRGVLWSCQVVRRRMGRPPP